MGIAMKVKIRIIFILFFLFWMMLTPNIFAAGNISILKVDTLIMEKGSDYYSVTVKALVKNDGEADDVTVDVVATDFSGFDLATVTLNGFIKQGQTKVLFTVIKISQKEYEDINRWLWDGGWSRQD